MKRCGRTAQSPLYLSLSVLNIYTQNRLQVNAQTKKMKKSENPTEREGGRGEEKVGGIKTKLQSFVSQRWKDGGRREEGGGGFR